MFKFEKLAVWQKAIAFSDVVYSETRFFPTEERFGLTSQMRRAASSVASNIDPDFARFLSYATGSLYETVTQAAIAQRQGFLSEEVFRKIYRDAEEISRMLTGLRDSLSL